MKQSESIANLAKALATVQQHITPVVKDRTNPHFKNNYATLDAIMENVRPLLAGHGLAIVQGGGAPVSNADGNIVGAAVETMLVHQSGEFITSAIVLPIDKGTPQAVGSAITYGRRYGVAALLALTTEEDDDGNHASAAHANAAVTRPVTTRTQEALAAVPKPARDAATERGLDMGTDEPLCPKCDGEMWDNRIGKRNPKAPDWKCKDKACDGVIWPPKGQKASSSAKPGRESASGPFDDAPLPTDSDFIPF
jgi:hypothetical protein